MPIKTNPIKPNFKGKQKESIINNQPSIINCGHGSSACAGGLFFGSYADDVRVRGYVRRRTKGMGAYIAQPAGNIRICAFRCSGNAFCGIVYGPWASLQSDRSIGVADDGI
jgi:hypothetical protein